MNYYIRLYYYIDNIIFFFFFFESTSREKHASRKRTTRIEAKDRTVLQWKMVIGREGAARSSLGSPNFTFSRQTTLVKTHRSEH